jgi:hypothetical protein
VLREAALRSSATAAPPRSTPPSGGEASCRSRDGGAVRIAAPSDRHRSPVVAEGGAEPTKTERPRRVLLLDSVGRADMMPEDRDAYAKQIAARILVAVAQLRRH